MEINMTLDKVHARLQEEGEKPDTAMDDARNDTEDTSEEERTI